MEDKKKKKKISLLQAVAAELVILLAIGVAFYWAEYRISASIFEAYSAVSREMDNVTNLYKDSVLSKADSLALYADLTPGVTEADLQAMEEMLDVDRIYLRNTWQESDDSDVVSYASRMSDGRYVVIACDADRYWMSWCPAATSLTYRTETMSTPFLTHPPEISSTLPTAPPTKTDTGRT